MNKFYEILCVSRRLQAAFKFLIWLFSGDKQSSYKHFPTLGEFSHKFSIARGGETTDPIKKLGVQKMVRTRSIIMPSIVGIMGGAPAVDEKV